MTLANPISPLKIFAQALTDNFSLNVSAQPEDQLKTPVDKLLKSVAKITQHNLDTRTEAHLHEIGGRPDLAVLVDKLLTGYVELKAPGKGARPEKFTSQQDRNQWQKFKQIPNLVYTDGNQWGLYRSGVRIGKIIELSGDVTSDGQQAISGADVVNLNALLADFFAWAPIVPTSPKGLAEVLAPLCHMLREDVLFAVSKSSSNLHSLAAEWRAALFPDADDAQFADAYAQTITYALLLAKLTGLGKDITPSKAADVLDVGHGLLAQALRVLADQQVRAEIGIGIELLERTIAAIDPDALKKKNPDLWLYFYEDFLEKYDPKLRKDRGAYYTPAAVIQAQCHLVSVLLTSSLGKSLSFADDKVVLLDPAAGTGAYPLYAIQYGLKTVSEKYGEGAVPSHATSIAHNTHAFEILVGPYAVAHLRLSQQILDAGGTLPEDGIHVYLTDTLESPFSKPTGTIPLFQKKLADEHKRARAVKEKTDILVCIGNPPYDRQEISPGDENLVERKGGWVRKQDNGEPGILEDFLSPARVAGKGQDLKNLYNDYVYFWRWAIWKVLEQNKGPGIISFITASSFLRGPGFVGMRQLMRKLFDEIWFIDLEGSNAGARKTENVFAIGTPVVITIGIRYGVANENKPAKAHYVRLVGSKEEKLSELGKITGFSDLQWRECSDGWSERFLPRITAAYGQWPTLMQLFPWQVSGAQVKRRWPIGETKEVLKERWREFGAASSEIKKTAFGQTRDRKITKSYDDLFSGKKLQPLIEVDQDTPAPEIVRYAFRSLDRQWLLLDNRVGDYLRASLWKTLGPTQLFLTTLLSDVLGLGPASIVTNLVPDLHYFCNRGAKDVVPLWRDRSGTEPNITSGTLAKLEKSFGYQVTALDLFAYVYALMSSPDYVKTFWEELEHPGPRLPITKEGQLFRITAELGKKLIWLHTYGEICKPGSNPDAAVNGDAKCTKTVSVKDYPETFEFVPETNTLRVGVGEFHPVSAEVYQFSVSDFPIVQSWLAYRMKDSAGKTPSTLDKVRPKKWTAQLTRELLELLWVVEHTLALQSELNDSLASVLASSLFTAADLPIPTAMETAKPTGEEDDTEEQQQEIFTS